MIKPKETIDAIGGVVDGIFGGLDELFTSDEERGKLKLAAEQLKAGIQDKLLDFRKAIQAEITARHAADMKSDSFLAKNVRPLTLIAMVLITVIYLFYGLNMEFEPINGMTHPKVIMWQAGLGALVGLDMLVFSFYFGSRGVEKVAERITKGMMEYQEAKKKAAQKRLDDDDGEIGW